MPYLVCPLASLCEDTLRRSYQLHTLPTALASPPARLTRRFEYGMQCQAHRSAIRCKDTASVFGLLHTLRRALALPRALWTFGYGMLCLAHLSASCAGSLAGLGQLHTPPKA